MEEADPVGLLWRQVHRVLSWDRNGDGMRLTGEAEYAIRALTYLASVPSGQVRSANQVAEACGLPGPFLSKTLGKLARAGLLRSARGRSRGYRLARSAREINVREILEAVEGSDVFRRCVFWDARCSDDRPCALHGAWVAIRKQLLEHLEGMTLEDVSAARPPPNPPGASLRPRSPAPGYVPGSPLGA